LLLLLYYYCCHEIKAKEAAGFYSPIKMFIYSIRKTGTADIAWYFHA